MKGSILKPLAVCLCGALLLSTAGTTTYALTAPASVKEAAKQTEAPAAEAKSTETSDNEKTAKDETVYIVAGADGSVEKVIVSDWIKNALNSAELKDKSELSDIENVKGDETFTMNDGNMLVWDAHGNDIYYQGSTQKALPVDVAVTYELDGQKIAPADLAGKSGHVTIRFDYKNNQYEEKQIGGKTEKIYVPFAMLTGMLLDNKVFSNVTVSNGKLVNDGDRMAVIGIAFPGLQSNLAIEKADFDIPDSVEISADVKNFSMATTMTVATNQIFNEVDPDKLSSTDSLAGSLDQLVDAMDQLTNGSSQLYDGLCTLLDKSGELISGINKLADGAKALKTGAGSLNTGATQLAGGLQTLSGNNAALTSASKQVFESLLSTAASQLAASGLTVPTMTIDNYDQVLTDLIASLDEDAIYKLAHDTAVTKVKEGVRANETVIRDAVTAAVQQQVEPKVEEAVRAGVEAKVLGAMGMTKEKYDAAVSAGLISKEQQAQVSGAISQQMSSAAVKGLISQQVSAQMQSSEITALIEKKTREKMDSLVDENMNSGNVQQQISGAVQTAKSGAASIQELKTQLDSYKQFYNGLQTYTKGVADAAKGADTLKKGTASLYQGAGALYDGIAALQKGAPALTDGITKLRDGAMKLSDGLKEFNEKGVQKFADSFDGDLNGLLDRIRATADVSKEYRSFSGISDDMDGQVNFVYRTEPVESAE